MSGSAEAVPLGSPVPAATSGPGRWHYVALVAIILLGAALRFAWLDRPVLWGDEAATWARTCGTFQEMLDNNRGDSFVPLHYELYWAMGKAWKMTPWRMRLVPAIAGTLMVPAMYFLARQLVRSRVALLVALLTAVSAFMLNYSRDAKMYMHFWLFLTLHMAFLLWWLRGAGGIGWWAWVACGVAAVGLHSLGWLLVPVELVILLTCRGGLTGRRQLVRGALFAMGLAIMAVGPVCYYQYYNHWAGRSDNFGPGFGRPPSGPWIPSGITWIEQQNRDKTDLQLVRDSATALLYGYSRAEEETGPGEPEIPAWIVNTAWGSLAGIVLILLLGILRWPRASRETLVTDPPWQLTLWLTFWLVFPVYGLFYCRSVPYPLAPHHWLVGIARFVGWNATWALPICLGLILIARSRQRAVGMLAWLLVMLLACVLALSVWKGEAQWYLELMDLGGRPWIIIGLTSVALAMTWSSMAGPERRRRVIKLAVVALVVLGLCEGTWWLWEMLRPSAGRMGADWQSIWMPRYVGVVWPAVTITMALIIGRLPSRFPQVIVITALCALNLGQHIAHVYMDNEPRLDLMAHDMVQGIQRDDMKVYVRDRGRIAAPAMASVSDNVGRYYLAMRLGGTYSPREMHKGSTESMITINRPFSSGAVAAEMRSSKAINRIVLWDKLSAASGENATEIQQAMGADWVLRGQWTQEIWRHWNWQHIDTLRRLEFVRASAVAAQSRPASSGAH